MDSWIRVDSSQCSDFETAFRLEWLETNGIGGSASSTVSGANSRRHHGLLATGAEPRLPRLLMLSALDESLTAGESSWELSTHRYADITHPTGYLLLREFRLDPFPTYVFGNELFELEKTVLMVQGQDTTLVLYRLKRSDGRAQLELRPLLAMRNLFDLSFQTRSLYPEYRVFDNRIVFRPYSHLPELHVTHNGRDVRREGHWYRSLQVRSDLPRGHAETEDLFNPCSLRFDLSTERLSWLVASTRTHTIYDETVSGWIELETYRRRRFGFVRGRMAKTALEQTLLRAADQFVVRRPGHPASILACYPAGRNGGAAAMVSLTGLTLVTGRGEDARRILIGAASCRRNGLLLEHLPETGESGIGSDIEASLWFIHAVERYLKYTGDLDSVREAFYPVVLEIIQSCKAGLDAEIGLDEEGLLFVRDTHSSVRGQYGSGKHVHIQALWYHALCVASFLAQSIEGSRAAREYSALAHRCKTAFIPAFWNPSEGRLFDRIDGDERDSALRPHQVLAVALPSSMLSRKRQQAVVTQIQRHLLTPFGMRQCLEVATGGKQPGECGERPGRAAADVEPWWLGPYASAYLTAFGRTTQTRNHVRRLLEPIERHLQEGCLGTVSSLFSGVAPHEPRGATADARGVAELLRIYAEEIRDASR